MVNTRSKECTGAADGDVPAHTCLKQPLTVTDSPPDHDYCLGHARVYNRLHAISARSPYHLHTNKFDFTLLGLSKSDLEVVRSMPQ